MCGRFEIHSPIEIIAEIFGIADWELEYPPHYNIAPSQDILIVVNDGKRRLIKSRWGFVPSWSQDLDASYKMINARAETVASSKAFKSAFEKQRCLVVADGFYEWRREGTTKKPFYVRLKSHKPFGFAGLYNAWRSPDGELLTMSTIITTGANQLVMPIHERMPVIAPVDKYDLWLDPRVQDSSVLPALLNPYPSEEMELFPVTPKVNSFKFDSPESIEPLDD
ncbi:MAG: SOS response-associated peptidase [Nitrospirota bacterium]